MQGNNALVREPRADNRNQSRMRRKSRAKWMKSSAQCANAHTQNQRANLQILKRIHGRWRWREARRITITTHVDCVFERFTYGLELCCGCSLTDQSWIYAQSLANMSQEFLTKRRSNSSNCVLCRFVKVVGPVSYTICWRVVGRRVDACWR